MSKKTPADSLSPLQTPPKKKKKRRFIKKKIKAFRRLLLRYIRSYNNIKIKKRTLPNIPLVVMAITISLLLTYGFPLLYYLKNFEQIQSNKAKKKELAISQIKPKPKKEKKRKLKIRKSKPKTTKASRTSAKFNLALGSGGAGVGIQGEDIASIIFKEGEVDKPARIISSAKIEYPASAADAGIGGEVELQIIIDESGKVIKAIPRSEDPRGYGFAQACMDAIFQYKFRPAMKENVPVKMEYIIPFKF